MEMNMETQCPTNEQYKNALMKHLGDSSTDESMNILATLVHCTKVLNGDAEGIKKDAAADLRIALQTNQRGYKPLVAAFQSAISDGRAVEMVQPFMVDDEQPEVVEEQPEVVEDIDEIVDEQPEVVDVDTNPVGITEDMVRAIVNDANASLLKKIRREIGKLANQPVAKATPSQPKVESKPTTPKVEEQPEVVETSTEGGLKVRSRKPFTPTGWKDKQHYSVAAIYDQVDNGQQVAIVKGLTAEEATAKGRNSIRRHLIRAFDSSNGNKVLTKATQDKETWVGIAAEHGITDAVCDLFLTNPNKYVQQSRRTGLTRRTKLGITDTNTFIAVAMKNIGSAEPTTATPPSLFDNDVSQTVESTVATVDANKVASLMQAGLSAEDAVKAAKLL